MSSKKKWCVSFFCCCFDRLDLICTHSIVKKCQKSAEMTTRFNGGVGRICSNKMMRLRTKKGQLDGKAEIHSGNISVTCVSWKIHIRMESWKAYSLRKVFKSKKVFFLSLIVSKSPFFILASFTYYLRHKKFHIMKPDLNRWVFV